MSEDRIITATDDDADDLDEGTPSKTKIKDLEFPQSVEKWWSRANFVRITSWISFWLSFYYFMDALIISVQTLSPDELNQDRRANLTGEENFINAPEPAAIIMFACIYLVVNN